MSSFYKTKGALEWKATFSAKRIEYLKNFLSFLRNLMKLRRYGAIYSKPHREK